MHAPVLHATTSFAEQEWNQSQLASKVISPCARVWCYPEPGVVFGCTQEKLASEAKEAGRVSCEVLVRRAGGGAVLTGPWMLSTSIVLPADHRLLIGGLVSSYRWFGVLHAGLLRDLGIDAHAITPEESKDLQSKANKLTKWACFSGYSPWEVVVGNRKIVGLAQFRRQTGVMLTSGILIYEPDWEILTRCLGKDSREAEFLANSTIGCEEALGGQINPNAMAMSLMQMLKDVIGGF